MFGIYPAGRSVVNRFMHLNGQHFGIMESQILTSARGRCAPDIRVLTANMPSYHKILINENAEINHHLSGYGMYFDEAMIRLLGEGIERYALMLADIFHAGSLFKASYKDAEKMGEVMPWEYISMYSGEDYGRLEGFTRIKSLSRDEQITWIKAASLFEKDRDIFIPAQLLVTGFRNITEEKLFAPGFSKGTASHRTFEEALKSALLEAVEADAFTTGWYTKRPAREIIIDDIELLDIMDKMMGGADCDIMAFDISVRGMPGYSVCVGLFGKDGKRPAAVVGCQCDLDPKRAIYKAFLEALAVYYLAVNGPLLMPELYLKKVRDNAFNNLDSNVAYWADTEGYREKQQFFRDWCSDSVVLGTMKSETTGDTAADIEAILRKLRSVSEYGVYMDITPPEVSKKGWYVVRTFFPELVQMCLPAYPYSNHPRIREMGGIKNELPHPVP